MKITSVICWLAIFSLTWWGEPAFLSSSSIPASASMLTEPTADLYEIGQPLLQNLWIDPLQGNDQNSGADRQDALRTIAEAWNRIPFQTPLATGYQLLLVAGDYGEDNLPPNGWVEGRLGSFNHPVIWRATDGAGSAHLLGPLNAKNCSYFYLIGLNISVHAPGGNLFHFEACDHLLLRQVTALDPGDIAQYDAAQETLKANQCQYLYIEDCDLAGAYGNVLDFVAVQYGHILHSRLHHAGDWVAYLKGGSAYFVLDGNEIYDGETGGFSAGQETSMEFMVSPWLHYEASDIRFTNNVVHDTEGAGLGVNGGYNVLFAYNTLYRVGCISHALEFVQGIRSCGGDTTRCQAYLDAGGWGTAAVGVGEPVPNHHVYVFNNLLLNPPGFHSAWSQMAIASPRIPSSGSNIPSPAFADDDLLIRGNLVWNGPLDLPLCEPLPETPSCNENQLRSENSFNCIEPLLVAPIEGDFHPVTGSSIFDCQTYAIPDFPGGDRRHSRQRRREYWPTSSPTIGMATSVLQGDLLEPMRAVRLKVALSMCRQEEAMPTRGRRPSPGLPRDTAPVN